MKKILQIVLLSCVVTYSLNAQISTNFFVFGGGCDSATYFNAIISGGVQPYTVIFYFDDGNFDDENWYGDIGMCLVYDTNTRPSGNWDATKARFGY